MKKKNKNGVGQLNKRNIKNPFLEQKPLNGAQKI